MRVVSFTLMCMSSWIDDRFFRHYTLSFFASLKYLMIFMTYDIEHLCKYTPYIVVV